MSYQLEDEDVRRQLRRQKMQEMRKQKQRQVLMRRYIRTYAPVAAGVLALFIVIAVGCKVFQKTFLDNGEGNQAKTEQYDIDVADEIISNQVTNEEDINIDQTGQMAKFPEKKDIKSYIARADINTKSVGEEVISKYAIFIDLDEDIILAQREAAAIIDPASMTKILTVLVAAEHLDKESLDDTFTMTIDITDYCYKNDCSIVGFAENEEVTVKDLLYGTVLPSGADAAVGLATYVAGSHEEFVVMMNEKIKELGLSDTAHFTNCVGLYDEEHYCTVYDMAMILEAAIDNELCREILSAHTYTTSATKQHPEGITVSNWFLRRIEDKDTGGKVICGKTGYVMQSGNCAASYGIDNTGMEYICVTADSTSSWRCIYDHVALYKQFSG